MKKKSKLEEIDQRIFAAKNDKERKMWESIKKKLLEDPPTKPRVSRKPSSSGK